MEVYRGYYTKAKTYAGDDVLRELFVAYRRGEEPAADAIVHHLLPVMKREAMARFGGRREDAEDAAQTAMLNLLVAVKEKPGEVLHPKAFARRIAHNVSLNEIRRQKGKVGLTDLLMDAFSIGQERFPTPEEECERREVIAEVRRALGLLDLRCRELVHDRMILGKKFRELHGKYGYTTEQAVHKRYVRCREKLKKLINQGRLPRLGKVADRVLNDDRSQHED